MRPAGWIASIARPSSSRIDRIAEPASRASSSARQPCTSPITSNGPRWSRRSVRSRSRTIVAASTSATPCSTCTRRNPSLASPRSDRRRSSRWRRTTCAPKARSGRAGVALKAHGFGDVEHDRHRQDIVRARKLDQLFSRRAAAHSSRRSPSAARRRAASPAMSARTSKASAVAAWSFSSPGDQTRGRSRWRASRSARSAGPRTWTCPTRRHRQERPEHSCGIASSGSRVGPA